jgi:hypothetical protein
MNFINAYFVFLRPKYISDKERPQCNSYAGLGGFLLNFKLLAHEFYLFALVWFV